MLTLSPDHRSPRPSAKTASPDAHVCPAVEDRGVPQDPQIRLPSRGRKLRTADRLANLVAVFCIVSWRVLWLTMMARTAPKAPATIAMTAAEISILDRVFSNTGNRGAPLGTLKLYLTKLARLRGYLARASDPSPGNTVVWRGLRRLADIQLGAEINTAGRWG